MTQLDALRVLAEKVEKGVLRFQHLPPHMDALHVKIIQAYDGSLDAAKALHDAVLPGWDITHFWGNNANGWTWCLTHKSEPRSYSQGSDRSTPARAWLLAIIRAKISELESEQ